MFTRGSNVKKLDIISNKIKSNSLDYFGRGHFESIIKENSKQILEWFEQLLIYKKEIM